MIRRLCTVFALLTISVDPGSNSVIPAGLDGISATVNLRASGESPSASFGAASAAVGIHFVGASAPMGAAETAGVVPMPNWNNATGASSETALALVDESGAPSGATVIWSANNVWRTSILDQAGNRRLMRGFKYVMLGSIRIGATESNSKLTVYAFHHPTTGRVTVVGRNIGGSSITLSGSLSNVGSVAALQLYQTSISNNYGSFTRGSDAVVTSGSFIVTVAANSHFTLTSPGQ
jgi:hypothetical protein